MKVTDSRRQHRALRVGSQDRLFASADTTSGSAMVRALPPLAIALTGLAVLSNPSMSLVSLLAAWTCAPSIFVILNRLQFGRINAIDPLVIFTVVWSAMFMLRPMAMADSGNMTLRGRFSVEGALTKPLVVAALGALMYAIGDSIAQRNAPGRQVKPTAHYDARMLGIIGYSCALIGVLAALSSLGQHLDGGSAYRNYLPLLILPALVLLRIASDQRGRTIISTATQAALIAVFLVRYVPTGQRAFVLYLAAVLIMPPLIKRSKEISIGKGALAAVVMLFVVMYQLQVIRDRHRGLATDATGSLVDRVHDQILLGGTTEMLPGLAHMLSRQGTDWTPQPFRLLYVTAVHWVPSSLWSAKPKSYDEALYARWFPQHYSQSKANVQLSVLGDFYTDSIWLGVVVGMFALGYLFRKSFQTLITTNDPLRRAPFFYLPVLQVLILRGNIALNLGICLFIMGPILIARRFAGVGSGP